MITSPDRFTCGTTVRHHHWCDWCRVQHHPVLSTSVFEVVLSLVISLVLSSKEEGGELVLCSPHFFRGDGAKPQREEGGP